jgi:hypothetical protein
MTNRYRGLGGRPHPSARGLVSSIRQDQPRGALLWAVAYGLKLKAERHPAKSVDTELRRNKWVGLTGPRAAVLLAHTRIGLQTYLALAKLLRSSRPPRARCLSCRGCA